jgi:hypothetical protein
MRGLIGALSVVLAGAACQARGGAPPAERAPRGEARLALRATAAGETILASDTTRRPRADDRYALRPDTLLQLARSECYGSCPVYSVAIRGDGRVFYYGTRDTGTVGFAERRIEPKDISNLLAFMRERKYLTFPHEYRQRASDHPSATTALRQGATSYKVQHDLSNRENRALIEIEHEIDRVAGTKEWVSFSGSPPGIPLPAAELRAMAEIDIRKVERQCRTRPPSKATLEGRIDHEGHFQASSLSGGRGLGTLTCLNNAFSKVEFPLVDVRDIEPIELSLGG